MAWEKEAAKIVAELLPEISPERAAAITAAILEWGYEMASDHVGTALESAAYG